jgi:hypothetical protein
VKPGVDAIRLAGSMLRVSAAEPLPADLVTLAVATAIRVFERFPALDGLVLGGGSSEVSVNRGEVEHLLAPEGFAALQDGSRWPQVLARAIQRYVASDGATRA